MWRCWGLYNLDKNSKKVNNRTAVALGIFDGVHMGHRAVICTAIGYKKQGLSSAVFTFNTQTVTTKSNGNIRHLVSDDIKHMLMSDLGVEYIYSANFSDIKDLSAEEFVKEILVDKFNAKVAVCGENFKFGKGGTNSGEQLKEICGQYDIDVVIVPFIKSDNDIISSTIIRRLIRNGEISYANRLLGYDYCFNSIVIKGNQIGRTLDFPTINQEYDKGQIVPKFGVYASVVVIDECEYPAVTNIGIKPTIGNQSYPIAETHIYNFNDNLYDRLVTVKLKEFLRSERKFENLEDLKAQLQKDIDCALKYHNGLNF